MNQTECIEAEAAVIDTGYNIVRVIQIICGITTLILILKVILSYRTKQVKLHKNLIVLVINVLLLDALFVLSFTSTDILNFYVSFTYKNSCDCFFQVWVVYLVRIPFYLYVAGSPLIHFAIMIERIIATIFVRIYENQGKLIAVASTIIVWLLTFTYGFYVYISSIEDSTFSHPMVYLTLTSIYNAHVLIYFHYFFLFLVICIAIADYYLILRNQKIKSNFSITFYSLSQSYQAKQNILVMRIIFPLDFSYSFVFALFNILSSFIRSKRDDYGQLIYMRTYEAIILLLFIHAIIKLIIYDYFLTKQNDLNKNFMKNNKNVSSEFYFKSLNYAWK
ncbi:unnamed protein product [Meloidogyne enterolobii]|uniref:Uncharacterized protein n=1 Tax=Meloidogyne enterolobii TaxID=390850 RepID=A0ACB0YDU2_MELEN